MSTAETLLRELVAALDGFHVLPEGIACEGDCALMSEWMARRDLGCTCGAERLCTAYGRAADWLASDEEQ